MTEEIKPNENADVAKLQEQIKNLESGIASARKEGKTAQEEAKAARAEKAELEKKLSELEAIKARKETEGISEDEKKKLAAVAKELGFVRKEELDEDRKKTQEENFKQIESTAITEFLEKYPDLNTDENWTKIKEQFALYKTPNTLQGYRVILGKVRAELFGDDEDDQSAVKVRAELHRKGRLSLGGGPQGGAGDGKITVEQYQKRYPNLTKQQIEVQLSQLEAIRKAREAKTKK